MKPIPAVFLLLFTICFNSITAQNRSQKQGVLIDEFIFDTASFASCHAATIAETSEGLIAAWFGGSAEGNPDVEIWMSKNINGLWTRPVSIANGIVNDTVRYPCYNPVLYQVPGGDLLLFYKTGPYPSKWKGWMKTSKDNGTTWSVPKALSDVGGFIGPVKNKPVLLPNGVLLSPSSSEDQGWKIYFEISADSGKTWRMIDAINDGRKVKAIQPSVLVHKNGKLQVLARSMERAIMESWSLDNGETWSSLKPTELPNNNSGIDAVSLRDGRHLLVYNHVLPPQNAEEGRGVRSPLNLAWSKNGKKWYAVLILEDSPVGEYSYPSIIQSSDGMVHIVYTWRRQKIKYVKIDPSKLAGKKIKHGKWPIAKK